jgi:hypothetical protein
LLRQYKECDKKDKLIVKEITYYWTYSSYSTYIRNFYLDFFLLYTFMKKKMDNTKQVLCTCIKNPSVAYSMCFFFPSHLNYYLFANKRSKTLNKYMNILGLACKKPWAKDKRAASRQNQHSGFATSMDQDQPAHQRSLIRTHAVRLLTLLQVEKLTANSMDPDQTARMRRLVWIHAGCKRTMLVLSWCGSNGIYNIVSNKFTQYHGNPQTAIRNQSCWSENSVKTNSE